MTESTKFQPKWVSSPGDTISDLLMEKRVSLEDFSARIGWTIADTRELLEGKRAITVGLARKLQSTLGSSVEFWISRDVHYRNGLSRLKVDEVHNWVKKLPIQDLVRFGWIKEVLPSQEAASCLRFFGVPDVETWRNKYSALLQSVAFRTSPTFKSRVEATATWLRQGELLAHQITCEEWSPKKFSASLEAIRTITRWKDPSKFIPELQHKCAAAGVAVVVVRLPDGARASGATYFLSSKKAVLQLSVRYLTDDQFWFSFFHEAGHLLLHGQRLFLEGIDDAIGTVEEEEANEFAERTLIPEGLRSEFMRLHRESKQILRFAQKIGIAPGIVVGQLQHRRQLKPNYLNSLKRRYEWKE